MAQQIKQVGIMKAVGGRWQQVMGMYLTLVGIYGLLAVLVGVPLALWGGQWFTDVRCRPAELPHHRPAPPAYVIAIEVAVGLLVPLGAAVLPVRRGSRTSVVKALSATGVSASFGHGLVDRVLGLIHGLPRPIALSLRNTFLRKGRLALTLLTLVLASAVVMAVLTVRTSTLRRSRRSRRSGRTTRRRTSAARGRCGHRARGKKVPGVVAVETRRGTSASIKRLDGTENQGIDVVGLPWDSKFVTRRSRRAAGCRRAMRTRS